MPRRISAFVKVDRRAVLGLCDTIDTLREAVQEKDRCLIWATLNCYQHNKRAEEAEATLATIRAMCERRRAALPEGSLSAWQMVLDVMDSGPRP